MNTTNPSSVSNTWIKFDGFNNYVLTEVYVASNQSITLYDGNSGAYLTLNSSNIFTNNYFAGGGWTSFCPGFSLYGPAPIGNNTGGTTTKAQTTTKKLQPTTTKKPSGRFF